MFDIIKLIIILNYGSTSSTTFADRFMGYGAISDDIARFISEGYLSSKSIEIKSCRNDQNILASMENGFTPCQYIILNSGDIRSESDLLRLVLPFCEDEMKFKSQHLNPYGGGYGSVMECVRYTSHFFLTTVYEAYYSTKAKIEKFTPLVDIPLPTGCEWNWLWDLPNHEISNHSQHGQDGVLLEIFKHIGTTNRMYVEIGYNSNKWVSGSNTYNLNSIGWSGLLVDALYSNTSINLHQHFVSFDNIAPLLSQHNIPLEVDYLSIDIDSIDIWIVRHLLLASSYRPRVISIEYNSQLPVGATVAMSPFGGVSETSWNNIDAYYGASAGSIKLMAAEVGYELVTLVGFLDAILIRKDLIQDLCVPSLARFSNRVEFIHSCVMEPERVGKWVEYGTMVATNDVSKARYAATEQILLMNFATSGAGGSPTCLGFI